MTDSSGTPACGELIWTDGHTPFAIADQCRARWPEAEAVLYEARRLVPWTRREVWPEQALALAILAHHYDAPGALFVEVGTATGYSAAILGLAAPRSFVVTLNPNVSEHPLAVQHLASLQNVDPLLRDSQAHLLASVNDPPLDFVFVDGDHHVPAVQFDCRWFWRLRVGGLLLFHDYSTAESRRPTVSVIEAVDAFAAVLGRGFDTLVRDDSGVGMVGFVRRESEPSFPTYLKAAAPTPEAPRDS